MILTEPIPWHLVPVGAQVLLHDGDVPRTVLDSIGLIGLRSVLLEGWTTPALFGPGDTVRMVIMDERDAIATLAAAGLHPEIIETKDQ